MKKIQQTISHIYNPDNQSKEDLINGFVVRMEVFKRIAKDIKAKKDVFPEQHFMIEGKRGMGKTSMLLRLKYGIQDDPDLNNWLIPIMFNEEEYGILNLHQMWERIAELLEEHDEIVFGGLSAKMNVMFAQYKTDIEFEKAIFELLISTLKANDKKIIIFIDNFGFYIDKFKKHEIQRFRTILQTSREIGLVAATAQTLEATHDYKHPFYELFKTYRLRGLDKAETMKVLQQLGSVYQTENIAYIIKNYPERIESLRRLTGGVIRSVVLMFEIFADDKKGSSFQNLEALLDTVTPLYKHRMDELPAQQQQIVQALSLGWDALSTKELAAKTRLESKTVSAQLAQLAKEEVIERIETPTKNHLYRIDERFFNIWYLMRFGRKGDKKNIVWLTKFLEDWCSPQELSDRTKRHINDLQSGAYDTKGGFYMSQALANSKHIDKELQHELLSSTKKELELKGRNDLAKALQSSDLTIEEEAKTAYFSDDYTTALNKLLLITDKNKANFRIAVCYDELNDFIKAETYYLKAIDAGNNKALNNLAYLYQYEFKDFTKAEIYYLKAIDAGVNEALNNLALLYHTNYKDFTKAEIYYLKAIDAGNNKALNNLALLYDNEYKDFTKAEKYYIKAIDAGNNDALFNLALLYKNEYKDFVKAEIYYLKAIDAGNNKALNNLALLYKNEYKDFVKAEIYYLKAIDAGNNKALNNLALLYDNEYKDFVKAETYYLKAIDAGDNEALFNLALLYDNEFKDFAKAETYYLKAIDAGDNKALFNLAFLYKNEYKDFTKAEKYYIKAIEAGDDNALFNLAGLYEHEYKDFSKVKKLYENAIAKGNEDIHNSYAWLLFEYFAKEKKNALIYTTKAVEKEPNIHQLHTLACIQLWNNQPEAAFESANQFLYNEESLEDFEADYQAFLLLAIAKKQYAFVYDYFMGEQGIAMHTKNRFKPIWYALMHYMHDEHPIEYLRMGSELKETVEEIVAKIDEMSVKYQ